MYDIFKLPTKMTQIIFYHFFKPFFFYVKLKDNDYRDYLIITITYDDETMGRSLQ